MEFKIIEEKKNKLVFELVGESHTFCNSLKRELWNDDAVKASGYTIPHPLVGTPRFVIETTGKEPKKALADAAKRLQKLAEKFKDAFKSAR